MEKEEMNGAYETAATGKKEHPHGGHRLKLKNRFFNEGLKNFEPHTVLELLLFYSIPRRDTNVIAHNLIERFGSISEVFNAPYSELIKVDGVTENSAVLMNMIPQLFRVYANDLASRQRIHGRENIAKYVFTQLASEPNEKVMLVCMDNRGEMLSGDIIGEGSVNFAGIDNRLIFAKCLQYNATAAIIAHNHPRGYCKPSVDDIRATAALRDALGSMEVRLIDHVIVSADDYMSLATSTEYGMLF